jgi:hypothetical protein
VHVIRHWSFNQQAQISVAIVWNTAKNISPSLHNGISIIFCPSHPRPCCSFLNRFVLHNEVVSLMLNPLPGAPGVFLLGTHTPSPCISCYSCGTAVAVLVCPWYFIPWYPPPI